MLTIKQITENTEAVIRGLEKKHFKNAKETIDQVIALNDKRRTTQNQIDKNLGGGQLAFAYYRTTDERRQERRG